MVKSPVPMFVPLEDGMDKYDVALPKNDKLDIYIIVENKKINERELVVPLLFHMRLPL